VRSPADGARLSAGLAACFAADRPTAAVPRPKTAALTACVSVEGGMREVDDVIAGDGVADRLLPAGEDVDKDQRVRVLRALRAHLDRRFPARVGHVELVGREDLSLIDAPPSICRVRPTRLCTYPAVTSTTAAARQAAT